jgi:glycosyltransferase involved in cell wall biosynthesis
MIKFRVSVVICTYNRGRHLERCIESIKKQTYTNYEIIVVNGPSTDDTDTILQKYDTIKTVQQQTLNGLSYARNLGINASKGDIIAFIDDDAVADENWIKYLIGGYSDSSVGGVGGLVYGPGKTHAQFDNGTINKCGIPSAIRKVGKPVRKGDFRILMGTNCSFRKEVMQAVGGFDPYFRYYHDESDICIRIIINGHSIVYERNAIVIHEMAEGHNRKSPHDLNWSEIVKNVNFLILKNFGRNPLSYSYRPAYALSWWLLYFQYHFWMRAISLSDLLMIYKQVFRGALQGYKEGIIFNIKGMDKNASHLTMILKDTSHVSQEVFLINSKTEIKTNNFRIKIAFLSQEYGKDCHGGICRYTYDLAHGLSNMGHEVHVITKSENDRDFDQMDENVHVHKIQPKPVDFTGLSLLMSISKKNLSYSYAACIKLLELTENFGIQIVEAPLWDAEGFAFSIVKNVPLIIRIETPLFKVAEIQNLKINKDLKLANWMEGEAVRRADRVIAISSGIGMLIRNHHNVPENKIDLCPLGIEFPDDSQLLVDQDREVIDVLFVGRLEKRKGIDTLFRAIPIILDRISNVKFTIIGNDTNTAPLHGSYKKHLLKALDKKYHKNVHFIGFVSDNELKGYYRNCDIFVAPSLYESFGLIFIEAMAWRKPVIGCKVGGIPEVIEDGITGFLIQPDDERELAEKIILLQDEKIRRKLGESARESVKNNFSIEKMVINSHSVYNSVIKNAKNYPIPIDDKSTKSV